MAWGIAKSLTRTLVVVVVMASCGGADNDSTGTTADDAETTTAPTTDPSGGPQLICEDPPPAEIGLGSPVRGTVAAATNFSQCFWVVVPEDVASISFELTDLTADLRMFLAYGFVFNVQYPGLGESWSASEEGTADEIVVIDEPKPGPYFLSVASGGFRAESPFTLTVRTVPTTTTEATGTALPSPDECALPSQVIDLGSSVTSEIAPQDELSEAHGYFCVEVPDGLRTVTIDVAGVSGVLDILVRYANDPTPWRARASVDSDAQVVIENPRTGAYFIDVFAIRAGESSTVDVSVSAP